MITDLIRSNLRGFKPYSSARSLYQKGVFMDANENSLGSVINESIDNELNRYPDPYSLDLRKALGKFLDVSEKNIFVGNGSDEAIDLLIRLFVEPDEEIIIMEPTYGMYKVAAEVAGVAVKNISLTSDFQVDVPNLLSQINSKTKIIFCCSPNNPTGTLIQPEELEKICGNFRGIVVVDEAYVEFASKPSLIGKISSLENLIILRTFSKAWGLAGIRVGYALAQETAIEYLNKIKPPYNLNRVSSKIAIQALQQYPKMLEFKTLILREREKLALELTKLGFEVFPSEANFLLVRYPNASQIAKKLAEDFGIIVRDFNSKPKLENCIRISTGTPEQNQLLIKNLSSII
ncbi:MAG: histidinol-phosphate transaminase [Candidatus Doudnabacteria bacterium]|nr:histidinol-phosphate transaminase [Candidatus Doudnabacteria bacterium]